MREVHVVGAAVLDKGRVLAAKRSGNMYPPLKWEFAGGKVEKDETYSQALVRELREELGVLVRVGAFVADGYFEDKDKKIILHVYEASIIEGTPVPREHSELRWTAIDDLAGLDWAEPDIPACRELMKRYGSICCG